MAVVTDPVQPAASNPASVPPVMPPPFASATCGSYGGNRIGEQLATWARTPIGLAFLLTAGTLLGFVLMKLLVLLGWAMDWSWLRDNPILRSGSDNCPNPAACVVAAGGAGGGSGGKRGRRGGKPHGKVPGGPGGRAPKGPKTSPPPPVRGGPASGSPKTSSPPPGKSIDPTQDPNTGVVKPGDYTPTPGYENNPTQDPAFLEAQQQAEKNNPGLVAPPSQPDSGGGLNYNQMIQNWYKGK